MKIYIVISFDEMFDGQGHSARIMKAFEKQTDAQEFITKCREELEEWDAHYPESEKEWQQYDKTHPFCFDDGYIATGFEYQSIEVE
jgi:hypothetical protein